MTLVTKMWDRSIYKSTPETLTWLKVWWIPTFSWLEKCLILKIFQLLLMNRKCASLFCRETETKIKQIKKNMEISFILDQSLVNRTLPSLNGGYLEIKLTVPLFVLYLCLVVFLNQCREIKPNFNLKNNFLYSNFAGVVNCTSLITIWIKKIA